MLIKPTPALIAPNATTSMAMYAADLSKTEQNIDTAKGKTPITEALDAKKSRQQTGISCHCGMRNNFFTFVFLLTWAEFILLSTS